MMVAAFLIGIPDSFMASKEFVAWASPWGVQPIHFAFWLLGIGVIYTWIFYGIKVRKLEGALPSIMVQPEIENDRAILVIRNNGAEADFTAKARVIATHPDAELYTMYLPKCLCLSAKESL